MRRGKVPRREGSLIFVPFLVEAAIFWVVAQAEAEAEAEAVIALHKAGPTTSSGFVTY